MHMVCSCKSKGEPNVEWSQGERGILSYEWCYVLCVDNLELR